MGRGLAYNRHQYRRRKKYIVDNNYWGNGYKDESLYQWDEKNIGICANTPNPCGCNMCANPRKQHGWPSGSVFTFQELKANDSANDMIYDMNYDFTFEDKYQMEKLHYMKSFSENKD